MPPTLPRNGRRAWSTRSMRFERDELAGRSACAPAGRFGATPVREAIDEPGIEKGRRLALPPRRKRDRHRNAGADVRRVPAADRFPLPSQLADRLDATRSASSSGSGLCCSAQRSSCARKRKSVLTSSTPTVGPDIRRVMTFLRNRARCALWRSLSGRLRLCDLHEGREARPTSRYASTGCSRSTSSSWSR